MGADPVPFGSRIETSCCAYIRITYIGKPQVGTLVNHSADHSAGNFCCRWAIFSGGEGSFVFLVLDFCYLISPPPKFLVFYLLFTH